MRHDLDNKPTDNGIPAVPKDLIVISRRSHSAHNLAEIWTVDELPCPPAGLIGMIVKGRHALPSLIVPVRPVHQIAGLTHSSASAGGRKRPMRAVLRGDGMVAGLVTVLSFDLR